MKDSCYHCKFRTVWCHANCEDYKEFKDRNDVINKKRHAITEMNQCIFDAKLRMQTRRSTSAGLCAHKY